MSLQHDKVYDYIEYSYDFVTEWRLNGPLSADLVAGLVLGLHVGLIEVINRPGINRLEIFSPPRERITIDPTVVDDLDIVLNRYLIAYEKILNNDHWIGPNWYGIWFNDVIHTNNYHLFTFQTPEFIQGFISACNAFNIDFRTYIAGLPFTIENGKKVAYTIEL